MKHHRNVRWQLRENKELTENEISSETDSITIF